MALQDKIRETPCERCGWTFKGDHFCFDRSKPEPGMPQATADAINEFNGSKKRLGYSDEDRAKAVETNKARWAEYRATVSERDQKIVELYNEGTLSMRDLAEKFNTNKTAIRTVLFAAADRGDTVIRSRGGNLRWQKQDA